MARALSAWPMGCRERRVTSEVNIRTSGRSNRASQATKEEYLEQDGVRFLMEDEAGSTVACRVSHEALRDHADRMHFSGTDGAVFDAYRELIEEVASEAHDAEGPFDEHGRILVTPEALARVTRSA